MTHYHVMVGMQNVCLQRLDPFSAKGVLNRVQDQRLHPLFPAAPLFPTGASGLKSFLGQGFGHRIFDFRADHVFSDDFAVRINQTDEVIYDGAGVSVFLKNIPI